MINEKTIAILLNAPSLGGAEKSMIIQASYLNKNNNITFFIPVIDNNQEHTNELVSFINEEKRGNIIFFHYPSQLYKISRSAPIQSILKSIYEAIKLIIKLKIINLHQYDIIWANGNKVGVIALVFSFIFRFQGKLFWHFRDYPSYLWPYNLIWNIFILGKFISLVLICNSDSVKETLKKVAPKYIPIKTIYNPSGIPVSNKTFSKTISTIGIVSMMAPWKGIHQIIPWASFFHTQLENLGIQKINIYGGNIYKTKGAHGLYTKELLELLDKFPSSLINFCGIKSTNEIFSEIDLLIHPVIKKEPFGRVIIEAYANQIPVISTRLGGTSEILSHSQEGLSFFPHDPFELFHQVKLIITQESLQKSLILNAIKKLEIIEESVRTNLQSIFEVT